MDGRKENRLSGRPQEIHGSSTAFPHTPYSHVLDGSTAPTYALNFMKTRRFLRSSALALAGVATAVALGAQPAPTDLPHATALRVFLLDGTSLLSYGEPALLGNRIVFSMPTSASPTDPQLHLVNIASSRVDWDRTTRYAEADRAARYLSTMAETHYAQLTYEITQALNDVAMTNDPARRLAIVERARKTLAAWPGSHFNYKREEEDKMVGILDEAIADLRAASGVSNFDLSFVATTEVPSIHEPLLPLPTPKEAIEQTLLAADLAEQPDERMSLLTMVLAGIDRNAPVLPSAWLDNTRRSVQATLAAEIEIDRQYRTLASRVMDQSSRRARAADVRGVERLAAEVRATDKVLGGRRAATVTTLLAIVEEQLDAARRLRLARDRWALRAEEFRRYRGSLSAPLDSLALGKGALEDIRALAGSAPAALRSLETTAAAVLKAIAAIVPPAEFQPAHALLLSAAQMADGAARIRREAAVSGDLARAWDASSAAAAALMLTSRARAEIETLLRLPQLPQ